MRDNPILPNVYSYFSEPQFNSNHSLLTQLRDTACNRRSLSIKPYNILSITSRISKHVNCQWQMRRVQLIAITGNAMVPS